MPSRPGPPQRSGYWELGGRGGATKRCGRLARGKERGSPADRRRSGCPFRVATTGSGSSLAQAQKQEAWHLLAVCTKSPGRSLMSRGGLAAPRRCPGVGPGSATFVWVFPSDRRRRDARSACPGRKRGRGARLPRPGAGAQEADAAAPNLPLPRRARGAPASACPAATAPARRWPPCPRRGPPLRRPRVPLTRESTGQRTPSEATSQTGRRGGMARQPVTHTPCLPLAPFLPACTVSERS